MSASGSYLGAGSSVEASVPNGWEILLLSPGFPGSGQHRSPETLQGALCPTLCNAFLLKGIYLDVPKLQTFTASMPGWLQSPRGSSLQGIVVSFVNGKKCFESMEIEAPDEKAREASYCS